MSSGHESVQLLNLVEMPHDSIRRLMWLSGVKERAQAELDMAFQRAYFQARQEGRLDAAMALSLHSHKRVMAWTRAENERTGRQWRWGDGRS